MTSRSSARARARASARAQRTTSSQPPASRARVFAFAAIVAAVLAVGGYLAFGDFFKRAPAAAGAIGVQSSMAGFSPSEIHVKAGQAVALDWWTDDSAVHLEDGVHTLISPDLDLYLTLPAEGRRLVGFVAPERPGTYDYYCDSCCGGRASPTMHGKIVVEV